MTKIYLVSVNERDHIFNTLLCCHKSLEVSLFWVPICRWETLPLSYSREPHRVKWVGSCKSFRFLEIVTWTKSRHLIQRQVPCVSPWSMWSSLHRLGGLNKDLLSSYMECGCYWGKIDVWPESRLEVLSFCLSLFHSSMFMCFWKKWTNKNFF